MEYGGDGRVRRGGVGEVRKIQIVYFLNRNGRMEQPHLIRVHYHHSTGGVRLRDVKGWLSQIRGKDMPGSYSWAYKRRYRNGYVWQDILEDDLITAVVDNEYVLMGSLISPSSEERGLRSDADDEEKQKKEINTPVTTADDLKGNTPLDTAEDDDASSKSPPPLPDDEEDDDDSPGFSAITTTTTSSSSSSCCVDASTQTPTTKTVVFNLDDKYCRSQSLKAIFDREEKEKRDRKRIESEDRAGNGISVAPSSSMRKSKSKSSRDGTEEIRRIVMEKDNGKREEKIVGETLIGDGIKANSYSLGKGRNNGGGRRGIAEHVFKNLIICGGAETHDSAVMRINRRRDGGDGKSVRNGGKVLVFGGKRTMIVAEFGKSRTSHVYSPAAEPDCSQCGKAFKPEMLHSHMKSCQALKEKVRVSSRSENPTKGQEENCLSKDVVPTFIYRVGIERFSGCLRLTEFDKDENAASVNPGMQRRESGDLILTIKEDDSLLQILAVNGSD